MEMKDPFSAGHKSDYWTYEADDINWWLTTL